jgi:threonylcarbamoyladenosine tRNA methylthiotransferase MtaB
MLYKNFIIITFGCKANKYESAAIENQLEKLGHFLEKDANLASLIIFNVCAVTQKAEKSCFLSIKKYFKPEKKIVITGCFSKELEKKIIELDENIILVPSKEKKDLVRKIFQKEFVLADSPQFHVEKFSKNVRAFVKIQDGCNNFCSYCIIPYLRGRAFSRSVDDVVQECEKLAINGYKEIVLTGINIGYFGSNVIGSNIIGSNGKGESLIDLLKKLEKIEKLLRIRISSINPDDLNNFELLDYILNCKKIMPSLHISLQSGSNKILKSMNRKYFVEDFAKIAKYLYSKNPNFTITTDVIVGFPSEDEKDFHDTVAFVRKMNFAKVHVFPFSKREGTKAYSFENHVDDKTKKVRSDMLIKISDEISNTLKEKFLKFSKNHQVLVETINSSKGYLEGFIENYLKVKVYNENDISRNDIIDIKLEKIENNKLIGKIISKKS